MVEKHIFEGQNIPEGKKSVAINVVIQAPDKTLTEEDLDMISQKIIKSVKEKFKIKEGSKGKIF